MKNRTTTSSTSHIHADHRRAATVLASQLEQTLDEKALLAASLYNSNRAVERLLTHNETMERIIRLLLKEKAGAR